MEKQFGRTLFMFDCSWSINNFDLYFTTLQSIIDKFYVPNRGDIFIRWDHTNHYLTYEEMQAFIKKKRGGTGTYIELIAKALKENKEQINHLIITTDGSIDKENVEYSDKLMDELNWFPDYVTAYLIGEEASNLSVVAPYTRNSPHIIYNVNGKGTTILEEVIKSHIKAFEQLNLINTKLHFMKEYPKIFNAMYPICRGKGKNIIMVSKLDQLHNYLSNDKAEVIQYEEKFNNLLTLALGGLENNLEKPDDASIEAREKVLQKIKQSLKKVDSRTFDIGDHIKVKQTNDDKVLDEMKSKLKPNDFGKKFL